MLQFVDRRGCALDAAAWQRLLRDPDYSLLAHRILDGVVITASWLGVVVAGEPEARPFLVTVRAKGRPKLRRELWCRTETEAQDEVDRAVVDAIDACQAPAASAKERA